MLDELLGKLETGTSGTFTSQSVEDFYSNRNNPFANSALNSSGISLIKSTYYGDTVLFKSFLDSVAKASNSYSVTASNGTAGTLNNADNSETYLLNANGFDYTAVIEKGLMGAIIYYQATTNYLSQNGIGSSIDNTTVVNGQGTTMEHNWDQAFGYFGVPTDFPNNTNGVRFFGEYTLEIDPSLKTNAAMMNAFLKGRAAISNKDTNTKDAQAAFLVAEWEKLVAASAIHELNEAKGSLGFDGPRNHVVSECYGFVLALKYNPSRKISDAQIQAILAYFPSNLYKITLTDINNIINTISSIYGFDSIKSTI
jgi:hypothetical protein